MKDKHIEEEEFFHARDKKEFRKERKILSKKDRSKYKKTDIEKKKAPVIKEEGLIRGRVLAIHSDGIMVEAGEDLYTCTLRGSLKKDTARIKNIIAVGDFVHFAPNKDETGAIAYVEERKSILSRAEQMTRRKEQLIAVNIDQVLITTSVVSPLLKLNLVDRYIIAAIKGNMQPIIVINKIDLLEQSDEETVLFQEAVNIYRSIDIPVYPVSTVTGIGIDALKNAMHQKSSVFSGQSGTGKTSLINTIIGSEFRTGKIIEKTKKGAHTTSSTHLLPIEGEGFCIDTPGIQSFGMWDLEKEDVKHYYLEIAEAAKQCRFPDCMHLQEPDCNVKKELEEGKISHLRFDSYCALIASLNKKQSR